jgi:hypothetical protein
MASSSFDSFLQFFIDQLSEEEQNDGSPDKKRKRPRKQREELEREDFQNAPWQRFGSLQLAFWFAARCMYRNMFKGAGGEGKRR